MKKTSIKRLIIFPLTALVLLCGLLVLAFSIGPYTERVNSIYYGKIDAAKLAIDNRFLEMQDEQIILIPQILEADGFMDAYLSADYEHLTSIMNSILTPIGLDYGVITDASGVVVHRINNKGTAGNIGNIPTIIRALAGDMTSSMSVSDSEPLRIVTTIPLYNENKEITGTLSIGRTLTSREFAVTLKNLTAYEITLFVGDSHVASSMIRPALVEAAVKQENIYGNFISEGKIYQNTIELFNDNYMSGFYPLRCINNDIIGMIFIGFPNNEVTADIAFFIVRSAVITLIFGAVAFILSMFTGNLVIKKIEAIEEHMRDRDMLFESVNKASFILLELDETDDIRMPLVSSMEYLGIAFSIDHVHLWRYRILEDGTNQFVREYSWVSEYAKLKAGTPKYINSSGDGVLDNWMKTFLENDVIKGIVTEMEPSHQKVLNTLHAKSIAMMPLYLDDQFWGMFTIDNMQEPKHYSDDEIYILRSISLMMANIVRRHDLQKENLKVYYDALTGINNRRFFDKNMARTISSLSRGGNELGLMMIDVDYFKKYNDTYGHGAGDECLIRVAEILAQSANRIDDFVARYGGEEFVAVMPNTDKEGAMQVAQRMIENVRAAKIPHQASDVYEFVTVSIGVTTGKVTHQHTPETYIQRADDMLYKSKHDGRNRATYGELEESKT